jgi:hypothetical protein
MAESRARQRIRKAVESRGYTVLAMEWEPWTPGGEKEGICGGWTVRHPLVSIKGDPQHPLHELGCRWFIAYRLPWWKDAA